MCHRIIISACWRSLALRSSSTEVRPSLNLLIHSHVWTRLNHSSPKAVFNISEVVAPLFSGLTQNLVHTRNYSLPTSRALADTRWGTGTQAHSTKAGEALPECIGLSFAPWREETQGHIPGTRHFPTPPPCGVTEPVWDLIDHTLYVCQLESSLYFITMLWITAECRRNSMHS